MSDSDRNGESFQVHRLRSINVAHVTLLPPHHFDVFSRLFSRHLPMFSHDLPERRIDILRHPFGISANIEIRPFFNPFPKLLTLFPHPVLNVDLFGLIPRKCEIETPQSSVLQKFFKILLIKKIGFEALLSKKEPVSAGTSFRLPLLEKSAKRRDPCPRPDHDDIGRLILRQTEAGRCDKNRHDFFMKGKPIGQTGRTDADSLPLIRRITDNCDGQMNLLRMNMRRGRYRIKPRHQPTQQPDKFLRLETGARKFLKEIDKFTIRQKLPRLRARFRLQKSLQLGALLFIGCPLEKSLQGFRIRIRKRKMRNKSLTKRNLLLHPLQFHLLLTGRTEHFEQLFDSSLVIDRIDSDRIPDRILDSAARQIDAKMTRLFLRSRFTQ